MATKNATIPADGSWLKVADAADDPVLIQSDAPNVVFQVAAVDVDVEPTVRGHTLTDRMEGISRGHLAGHLYARLMSSPIGSSEILIVSGSSESLT